MTTLKPSLMPAGNVVIKSFEKDGIHRHSQAIESYFQLSHKGLLAVNKVVSFDIPTNLQLISLWLVFPNATIQTDTMQLIFINDRENIIDALEFSLDSIKINPFWAVWEIPFKVITPDWKLSFSCSAEVNQFNLWAKEVNIESTILGQKSD